MKKDNDNPSIGLLLCKSKNALVAEYALKDMSKPIGVSEYKVTSELPEALSKLKYRKAESRRAIYRSPAVFILFTTQCYAKKWGNKIDNAFMLNATIRNGKLNGE